MLRGSDGWKERGRRGREIKGNKIIESTAGRKWRKTEGRGMKENIRGMEKMRIMIREEREK